MGIWDSEGKPEAFRTEGGKAARASLARLA
jgi:hypothetical protein